MSKLEMISELLVNELTDFEKDVNRLEESIIRAENLKVKFDTKPVEGLVDELKNYGREEKASRMQYLSNLEHSLKQAKIYPKWAIITFMSMILMCCLISFYAYMVKTDALTSEKEAHQKGINTYGNYMIDFFEEHPNAKRQFELWQNKDK